MDRLGFYCTLDKDAQDFEENGHKEPEIQRRVAGERGEVVVDIEAELDHGDAGDEHSDQLQGLTSRYLPPA